MEEGGRQVEGRLVGLDGGKKGRREGGKLVGR